MMAVHHKESGQKISWVKFAKADIERGHRSTFEEVSAQEIEATEVTAKGLMACVILMR
jgi:hypothetical protein